MNRALVAVGLVAGLAAGTAGVAWLGGDEEPRGGVLARPDVAPDRLQNGATSLVDLAAGAALAVKARGAGTVRVTVTPAGGRPVPLGGGVRAGADGRAAVKVPAATARALAGCRPVRLTVELTGSDGRVSARRSRTLAPQPPACGRFFRDDAVWNERVERAALDPLSATLVKDLNAQVEANFAANFPPTINTFNYSVPVYTVPASQPRVPVHLVGERLQWGQVIAAELAEGVPIPPGARAAWGDDHHMVIWQPATDTMWEMWIADDANGRWEAQWGGRMEHVSRSPGYFSGPSDINAGATATSLALVGGLITRADLARGEINHALAMAIPSSRAGVWAYPAQRSDGGRDDATAIPAGARFRLDPRIDVEALKVPPFTRMLARAAQRYGIYVRDTSPAVIFYAEDPASIGSNPWVDAIQPSAPEVLRAFPWKDLQVTRMDLRTGSGERLQR